jgi:hypothetical protein
MAVYVLSLRPIRAASALQTLTAAVAIFYTASIALFICTLYLPAARDFRSAVYLTGETRSAALDADAFEEEDQTVQQGGLGFLLHMFGYQLAAGVPLLASQALLSKRWTKWLAGLATFAGVATLLLAGQRSALIGAALVLPLILLVSRNRRTLLVLCGIAAIAFVTATMSDLPEVRKYNTVDRLQSSSDASTRLDLQLWALRQSVQYPLGIVGARIDYASIAEVWTPRGPLAPHNGYITRTLFYGWPVGIMSLLLFGYLAAIGWRSFRQARTDENFVEVGWLFATISVSANALFHNASVITANSDSVLAILMFASWVGLRTIRQSAHAVRVPARVRLPHVSEARA